MWILLLSLVVLAHADHNVTQKPSQHDDEIAFLRSEIYHLKNAVWGILQGFDKASEKQVTMGFRERYTSPYGEVLRKEAEELTQRRTRLFDQCIGDALTLAGRYPGGSGIVSINCDNDQIDKAVDIQIQQERAYAELVAKWSDMWDDSEDDMWDEDVLDEVDEYDDNNYDS